LTTVERMVNAMQNTPSENETPITVTMEGACLDFGGGAGVFDLNFSLPQGSILGMIGPSGCGKTTTIRLINGIFGPTAGQVQVFGKNPLQFTSADKARIGYIPQQFILYPNLSVEENMHFLGGIYGMPPAVRNAKIRSLLEFVEMGDAARRLGRKLSGGMQRRLMLAGALLHEPDLLIADEPTAGFERLASKRFLYRIISVIIRATGGWIGASSPPNFHRSWKSFRCTACPKATRRPIPICTLWDRATAARPCTPVCCRARPSA